MALYPWAFAMFRSVIRLWVLAFAFAAMAFNVLTDLRVPDVSSAPKSLTNFAMDKAIPASLN